MGALYRLVFSFEPFIVYFFQSILHDDILQTIENVAGHIQAIIEVCTCVIFP